MMKTLKKALQASLFVFGFALLVSPAMAANFSNMSFVGNYVERHPTTVEVFNPFLEKVSKDFDGKVSFNYFANNVLYPESESYSVFNDGRVDFGVIRPALFAGIMDLASVVDIPGMAPNSIIGSLVANDVYAKFPEIRAELPKDSVLFTVWGSASWELHTVMPVKNLDDIKGKKIIVWDNMTRDVAERLGANPIRLTPTDSYLSLSKGMADGVIAPLAPVRSFKISEVAKYHLMINLGVGTFTSSVYKPLWDEFSPEIQAYFKEAGAHNMGLKVGKSLHDGGLNDTEWMLGLGHEFYYLDDAGRAKFNEIIAPMKDAWVANMPAEKQAIAKEILKYAEERSAFYQQEFLNGAYGEYTSF